MRVVEKIFRGSIDGIRLAAKIYYPKNQQNTASMSDQALTLLFLHANGFSKEIWQETIEGVFSAVEDRVSQHSSNASQRIHIEKVVAFDVCHSGVSGELNHGKLGFASEKYNWNTNARDVLSVVEQLGVRSSQLVGVGHSYGGASIMIAELMRPSTFGQIFAVDPVITRRAPGDGDHAYDSSSPVVIQALRRRNGWANRQEFLDYIRSKQVYKTWTPECQQLFADYGTRYVSSDDGQKLVLSCAPHFEAATYKGAFQGIENLSLNKHMISCPIQLLVGDNSNVLNIDSAIKFTNEMPRGSSIEIPNSSHLLLMEYPKLVSQYLVDFLSSNQ